MVVEVADFEQEVIEKSFRQPVLVDFWAPWCGPCRMLGPVLERLATENEGRWTLAKLNTDENPAVARRYAISSIPAVKLFVDGRVADEFLGALPEASVRQWLDKAIPSESKRRLLEAQAAIAAGETETAKSLLQSLLAQEPGQADASVLLARLLAFDEPEEAAALARNVHGVSPDLYQTREAVLTLGRLREFARDPAALPEASVKPAYLAAIASLRSPTLDEALNGLVNVVRLDRRYDDDGARRACLAVFTLLGDQHELTRKHRRALEMALF